MARSNHFIVVLSRDFSRRLEIPRSFVKHIEIALGKLHKRRIRVKLAGPSGKKMLVFIERTAGRTHFTSGWSKFARDHMLKENEFVAFRYDGTDQFSAIIFDETLCERANMIGKEDQKKVPKVEPLSDSEDSETSEGGESSEGSESSEGCESSESDEEYVKEDEDGSEDYEAYSFVGNKPTKKRSVSFSSRTPHSPRKKYKGLKCVSRRRAVTHLEKLKAAEAAFSFTSNNPNCMMHMTSNMVYRWASLRFPMKFSKKYLPREKTKFVLKNSAGQRWNGSYFLEGQNSRKGLISRGWTMFARDNNLEEDDYCVFELVNRNEFLVHIFRVVEPIVPRAWIPK